MNLRLFCCEVDPSQFLIFDHFCTCIFLEFSLSCIIGFWLLQINLIQPKYLARMLVFREVWERYFKTTLADFDILLIDLLFTRNYQFESVWWWCSSHIITEAHADVNLVSSFMMRWKGDTRLIRENCWNFQELAFCDTGYFYIFA